MKTWRGCSSWRCSHGPESHTSCETRSATCIIWITSSPSTNWTIQRCNIFYLDSAPPESKKKKWRMLVHGLYHYEYHLKQYYRCFIWVISCETWTAKKDVHTNTSIYIFTFVQCMFMWLFHRAKYSSSAPPPAPLPLLWSYLNNTATLRCNQHYILYVDSYIITALTPLTCRIQT